MSSDQSEFVNALFDAMRDKRYNFSESLLGRDYFEAGWNAAKTLNPKREWIDINDRLPADGQLVEIALHYGNDSMEVASARWLLQYRSFDTQISSFELKQVAYWMPMPNVPTKKGAN